MNSTALRIRRKVCARLVEKRKPQLEESLNTHGAFFIRAIFQCAVFSRALTLLRLRHTLEFSICRQGMRGKAV